MKILMVASITSSHNTIPTGTLCDHIRMILTMNISLLMITTTFKSTALPWVLKWPPPMLTIFWVISKPTFWKMPHLNPTLGYNISMILLKIIVFATFLACICRYSQTAIFAKRINMSKYLEMLMVCTSSKFKENVNQTFLFTPRLHINSHETNTQVLQRFTSHCK